MAISANIFRLAADSRKPDVGRRRAVHNRREVRSLLALLSFRREHGLSRSIVPVWEASYAARHGGQNEIRSVYSLALNY